MAQHVQTPKEQCFEAAVESLQEVREDTGLSVPEISHQRIWTGSMVGGKRVWTLENESANIWSVWNSIRKRLGIAGMPDEPNAARGSAQIRFPDVTVVRPDGKRVVVDCKFDRKDGTRDQWGTKKGVVSRQDQREDYNDINEQELGKSDLSLSLDADTCMCPPGKKQRRVREDDPNFAQDWAGELADSMAQADADEPSPELDPYGPPFIGPPGPPLIGPPAPQIGPPPPPGPRPPRAPKPAPPPFEEDDTPTEDEDDPWDRPPPARYPGHPAPGQQPMPIMPLPAPVTSPFPAVPSLPPIFEPIFVP